MIFAWILIGLIVVVIILCVIAPVMQSHSDRIDEIFKEAEKNKGKK